MQHIRICLEMHNPGSRVGKSSKIKLLHCYQKCQPEVCASCLAKGPNACTSVWIVKWIPGSIHLPMSLALTITLWSDRGICANCLTIHAPGFAIRVRTERIGAIAVRCVGNASFGGNSKYYFAWSCDTHTGVNACCLVSDVGNVINVKENTKKQIYTR